MKIGFEDLCSKGKDEDRQTWFTFSKDELAQSPLDGEDVEEDGIRGEGVREMVMEACYIKN